MQLFSSQNVNLCCVHYFWIVDYYNAYQLLFGLLFLRHPFTAEDLLVSK